MSWIVRIHAEGEGQTYEDERHVLTKDKSGTDQTIIDVINEFRALIDQHKKPEFALVRSW